MMNRFLLLISIAFTITSAQVKYDKYFERGALRFDFYQAGDATDEEIFERGFRREPYFSGNREHLIDNLNLGYYYFYIYSIKDNRLIYSHGFSTLFQEWQTTDEAKKIKKAFQYSIRFPFPKDSVKLIIKRRGKSGKFKTLFTKIIDPQNYLIKNENLPKYSFSKIHYSRNYENALDIVFIPDGYTRNDSALFFKDAERFANFLFNYPPFDKAKNKINIWSVNAWSQESGVDIPGKRIYKNTVLDASFYTFDSERYLMVENYHHLADIASCVPYDQIYVIVNSEKYGGGAIYNFYNVTSAHNKKSELVFVHEFGHGLAGLADEYYTSDVSYKDYYDLSVEPWERNITTLVNFESKWESLVPKNVPVPTPDDSIYYNSIGVFEGGGYVAKGVYRPSYNSIMKSLEAKGFNEVCKRTILEVIDFYTGK